MAFAAAPMQLTLPKPCYNCGNGLTSAPLGQAFARKPSPASRRPRLFCRRKSAPVGSLSDPEFHLGQIIGS
jgi:hypothetical protein